MLTAKSFKIWSIFLASVLFSFYLARCTPASISCEESLSQQIEQAFEVNDWHTALVLCNQALELAKGRQQTNAVEDSYFALVRNTKFALFLTGELLEIFFSYGKYIGFLELFPLTFEGLNLAVDVPMHRFFSAMGLQSMAMASAFNRFEVFESPSALNDYIQSSLIGGHYRLETFVNRLEHHRAWREQARVYRRLLADTNAINADPFFSEQRKLGPKIDFHADWILDNSMVNLYFSNPSNQRAFEYTVALMLIQKVGFSPSEIDSLLNNFNYTYIPRHVEEAILVNIGYGFDLGISRSQMRQMAFGGMNIRLKTIVRHENFLQQLDLLQQGRIPFETFQNTFGDMYQYYLIATLGETN